MPVQVAESLKKAGDVMLQSARGGFRSERAADLTREVCEFNWFAILQCRHHETSHWSVVVLTLLPQVAHGLCCACR